MVDRVDKQSKHCCTASHIHPIRLQKNKNKSLTNKKKKREKRETKRGEEGEVHTESRETKIRKPEVSLKVELW